MSLKVNNVSYSWSMIQLTCPALTGSNDANPDILSGVTGIEYNIRRNIGVNYGLGGNPSSRGFGNKEYTGSITMDYNTLSQLRGAKGSLMDLGEFDLVISFANPEIGTTEDADASKWVTHTVTMKGCFFNEDGLSVTQDDTTISKTLDLNPFKIEVAPVQG